jgi:hypothetical protein
MMAKRLFCTVVLTFWACGAAGNDAVPVSLLQLLATPKKFVDGEVLVRGYLKEALTAPSLFATSEHAKAFDSTSAILLYDSELFNSACEQSWVMVEGRFGQGDLGYGILDVQSVRQIGSGLVCLDRSAEK